MVRIAFLGKMASGKSTVSSLVLKKYPSVRKIAIAEPIKEIATTHFGMKQKDRRLLQIIGNTGRLLDPSVWINKMLKRVEEGGSYVVDDVRFENEVSMLRQHGFSIVYLDVPKQERIARLARVYKQDAAHHIQNMEDVSENDLSPEDADEIWNNVHLKEIDVKLAKLVKTNSM